MEIKENQSLKQYNTFGIEVQAKYFVQIHSLQELKEIIQFSKDNQLEILILGGGSNILFTKNFEGIVIQLNLKGISMISEDENMVIVKAFAGENWHQFVLYCIENNWGGLENLSLIPGNIGTAPMQNIGAYGVEIKDVFHALTAFNISTFELSTFHLQDCEFGYRESVFKRKYKGQYIIIDVSFQLTKKAHALKTSYGAIQEELVRNDIQNPTIKDVSNAVITIRESKLPNPKEIGNAGSFFKNPVVSVAIFNSIQKKYAEVPYYKVDDNFVKIPAGWLIETLGFKGKTIENVGVHKKQALVLVNYGNGTGREIFNLSEEIINAVKTEFKIELEREVNII